MPEALDVLIVGAGISGIDAAYRLQTRCPSRRFAIVEARDRIGGTWDLFRYPGIRSDSDMHTLGFPFRPWTGDRAIADGDAIRDYIEDTAREFGIDRSIRFGWRVVRADWSSADLAWTVEIETADGLRRMRCGFLYLCSGYYRYDRGHSPAFAGAERFRGRIVHPQFWPGGIDLPGQRIVVIGSGATAVTLVPALVARGAQVTLLQRSPTYIVSRPAVDRIANRLFRWLPRTIAAPLVRAKNVGWSILTYALARRRPDRVRRRIVANVHKALREHFDPRDFTPDYAPWDQRVCLVPDGDLFRAIRAGKARVVTGRISGFGEAGVLLDSGETLEADIIVTATGLDMQLLGGAELSIDGVPVNLADRLVYRGMMLGDVPNLALAFGYVNASWTLKCDLTARHVCRLLNHMERRGYAACTPRTDRAGSERLPMLGFTSGYVERAKGRLPSQGAAPPWRVRQNYLADLAGYRFGRVADGTMAFTRAKPDRSKR